MLMATLTDPTWLGEDIVSGPEPWIPGRLTLEVSSADGRSDKVLRWPLDESIADLAAQSESGGGDFVCLTGDQVPPVWGLLGNGNNYRRMLLEDGDSQWRATVSLNWPGYRLLTDPCVPLLDE